MSSFQIGFSLVMSEGNVVGIHLQPKMGHQSFQFCRTLPDYARKNDKADGRKILTIEYDGESITVNHPVFGAASCCVPSDLGEQLMLALLSKDTNFPDQDDPENIGCMLIKGSFNYRELSLHPLPRHISL